VRGSVSTTNGFAVSSANTSYFPSAGRVLRSLLLTPITAMEWRIQFNSEDGKKLDK